jgi:hypothetical protein
MPLRIVSGKAGEGRLFVFYNGFRARTCRVLPLAFFFGCFYG